MLARGMTLHDAIEEAKAAGCLRREIKVKNLVTTVGRQFISRRITGQETVGLQYAAIGTGTTAPAISDTTLVSESLRKVLTECYQGDVYFYSTVYLLASECSFYIKEGGLFGGVLATATAGTGSMLARFLVDCDNSVDQEDLTMQHTGEIG
jgi:hypothetical protein